MTARYRINHTTAYRYDQAVTASFNEVRLTPAVLPWQSPLESTLRVEQASWQYRYVDYWGTQVRVFEAHSPHRELVVDVSSTVEVDGTRRPTLPEDLSWQDVRANAVEDEYSEFLTVSASTSPPPDLAAAASELAAQLGPAQAAEAVARTVHETMTYVPGSTGVHTLATEAWAERSGVCQDYAHLVVGALRHIGLPARYVSGYLHPKSEPVLGDTVTADSHAWVQWWLGEWVDFDPTNLSEVSERHILVGTGREYRDVTPIKGIVAGSPATTDLEVEVSITRLA
jgi:transglutaminase-like putative cysteine protease